jgi:hypothetical protein
MLDLFLVYPEVRHMSSYTTETAFVWLLEGTTPPLVHDDWEDVWIFLKEQAARIAQDPLYTYTTLSEVSRGSIVFSDRFFSFAIDPQLRTSIQEIVAL